MALNILNLQADGDALMEFLGEQKLVTGDDLKNVQVVQALIGEVGNMLESA